MFKITRIKSYNFLRKKMKKTVFLKTELFAIYQNWKIARNIMLCKSPTKTKKVGKKNFAWPTHTKTPPIVKINV